MPDRSCGSAAILSLFQYVGREDFRMKPFVVLGDDALTYGTLHDVMARTAQLFRESGIGLGDRIVICSEHEIEVIALYASALRLGVTVALIDPQSSLDEARILIRAAEPKALFIDRRLFDTAPFEDDLLPGGAVFSVAAAGPYQGSSLHTEGTCVTPEANYPAILERYEPLAPLPSAIPDETSAFILFTSGTTSRPKGVEVTHHALAMHIDTMHRQYGYNADS